MTTIVTTHILSRLRSSCTLKRTTNDGCCDPCCYDCALRVPRRLEHVHLCEWLRLFALVRDGSADTATTPWVS
jgi:hypothetical protein